MKFKLNLATLVVSVVVLWTVPVQSISITDQKLLLDVTANDKVWVNHLNMGIKFNKKTLSAAALKVLVGLRVIDSMPTAPVDSTQEPDQEQTTNITVERGHEPESNIDVVVCKALNIVVDVASHYKNHGVALEFALDTIASAITCNSLVYVLVQLYAIQETNNMQNDAISTQPQEVWHTLVKVLDKVAVFKKSFDKEFHLYQRWELVVNQNKSMELPPDFKIFQDLVEKSLNESCELSTFENIKKQLGIDKPDQWDTVDKTMKIFSDCQKSLNEMFDDIPFSYMNIKVWEIFLDKPEFKKQTESDFKLVI